ncbi:transposase is4 [Holotrichia oblita]|uniref:Transposase is4 n=1 Tax=Holotrichia oblita TaxID=644536 RepID=A0ACB9T0P7_HOLOL|nr:transposase is4 [Holotrichia oblita]
MLHSCRKTGYTKSGRSLINLPKILDNMEESMVPYYGKHYAKQYIRGKPTRFGFKNWALCTNEGYMVGFDIYTGKNSSLEKHFGVGGDIVSALLQQTEVPKN